MSGRGAPVAVPGQAGPVPAPASVPPPCPTTPTAPAGKIDPPTLSMVFGPNTSPLAGREGSQLTGTKIGERLQVGRGGRAERS